MNAKTRNNTALDFVAAALATKPPYVERGFTDEQIEQALAWVDAVRPDCSRAFHAWDLVEQNPTGDRRLDMRLRGLLTVSQATSEHLRAEKAEIDAWIVEHSA